MTRTRALLVSAALFAAFVAGGHSLVLQSERARAATEREAAAHAAAGAAMTLEQQLSRSLSATYALAAIVRQAGQVDDFDALAAEMIRIYGGIASLQLAPGGVVQKIHPLTGNHLAIGHDLLRDPERRAEVQAAIESRQLVLAGPYVLKQGGVGVVGRLAVFVPDPAAPGGERWWGLVTALLRLDDLLAAAQLGRLAQDGYAHELTRQPSGGGAPDRFAGDAPGPLADPVSFRVKVPGGEWVLSVAPAGGWYATPRLSWLRVAIVLGAAALAGLAWVLLRQPELLRREVAARTAELARANARIAEDAERRREAEAQLAQVQKMEAVGQLAGGIAHDFNNLLTGILAHAEMLAADAPPGSDAHDAGVVISGAASRAAELTKQLLGFARRGKLVIAPTDAHGVLHDVARLLRRTLDERIALVERLRAPRSVVLGDAGQLQQAVLNLAVNARDAMPDGGELLLETATLDLDAAWCERHPGATPGPHLAVAVVDSGHGIPPELQARIFEPFFTTKPQGRGTGMGLAMVYGIVRNHGGVVEVESAPGRGARFTVYLPLAAPEVTTAHAARARAPEAAPRCRVLVVDDDELPRTAAARILRGAGYDVAVAAGGEEAVRWFSEQREPAVVLLDLAMPGMDGGACFRQLRAIDPAVRVVLTSGYGRDGRAQELLDQGVRCFVPKPFLPAELVDAVSRAAAGA